jgi:hypothetical protein
VTSFLCKSEVVWLEILALTDRSNWVGFGTSFGDCLRSIAKGSYQWKFHMCIQIYEEEPKAAVENLFFPPWRLNHVPLQLRTQRLWCMTKQVFLHTGRPFVTRDVRTIMLGTEICLLSWSCGLLVHGVYDQSTPPGSHQKWTAGTGDSTRLPCVCTWTRPRVPLWGAAVRWWVSRYP